jgi:NAD(P)-dependent dehydrogenase (short-subunit alcohol dehydrogenase family)
MPIRLKPIREQVLVITGASSGIGLVTAREAARRGARVVLAARNANDLRKAVRDIRAEGGRAIHHVTDVADEQAVRALGEAAVREFGGLDSWVNNAAVALYGRLTEISIEDMRRQFDVNYWGQVYGSLTAVPFLREHGGAIINVASALADRAIPLQGTYGASKHALKAFTDTLRMELEEEGLPISVTLVKPGSIDTPFFQKARTYLGVEPRAIPPLFAPDAVARVILHCAEHPERDIIVGGLGKVLSLSRMAPRITDRYMERKTFKAQQTNVPIPRRGRPDNLYQPVEQDGGERGLRTRGRVRRRSAYTAAAMHPRRAAIVAAAAGMVLAAGLRGWRRAVAVPEADEQES